jgi:redox-sensitive bicupin YhaK (pirin superfamily)
MSAGTGILHSEFNLEDEETNLYQIWIKPKITGIKPAWDMAEFPKQAATKSLQLLVSGDKKAPLNINQDARIYGGRLNEDDQIIHNIIGKAYILISEGTINVSGNIAQKGDGLAVSEEKFIKLDALSNAELLIIEVPGKEDAR